MTLVYRKSTSSFDRLPDEPFVWTISSLRDFSAVGLRDGDYGVWVPTGSQPILLRYKAVCTFAGGGTVQAWMTPIAYAGTPVMQAYTNGTEDNTTLLAQGWTVLNDPGATVTATGGFQRLSVTTTISAAARLRCLVGTITASTRLEMIYQARAEMFTGNSAVWCPILLDGSFQTTFGQSSANPGLGFTNDASVAPLQTPTRNGTLPAYPTLEQNPATILLRDEGRTVLSSAFRDGLPLGDYRRNLQAATGNLLQISPFRFTSGFVNTTTMDFRGQVITY